MKIKKYGFTIREGFHRSLPMRPVRLNRTLLSLSFCVKDPSSMEYSFDDDDQYDWNKLIGFTYYFMTTHKESVRLAWRWSRERNIVEIGAYVYSNGVRIMEHFADFNPNSMAWLVIKDIGNRYALSFNENYIEVPKQSVCPVESSNIWLCRPYFGGNKRSPNKIRFNFYVERSGIKAE